MLRDASPRTKWDFRLVKKSFDKRQWCGREHNDKAPFGSDIRQRGLCIVQAQEAVFIA